MLTPTGSPTGRRLPLLSGQSLHPAALPIGQGSHNEASTRVHAIRPSGLPLACGRPDGTGRPWAQPRASHPADQEPDNARRGWGQAIEHGPGTTAQLTSVDLQSGSSLNACDLASHGDVWITRPADLGRVLRRAGKRPPRGELTIASVRGARLTTILLLGARRRRHDWKAAIRVARGRRARAHAASLERVASGENRERYAVVAETCVYAPPVAATVPSA